jgi:DNA invertase Pin-like site-specific DNA recombinase
VQTSASWISPLKVGRRASRPTVEADAIEVRRLAAAGLSRAAIAHRLGIGKSTVYRLLANDTGRV